MLILQEQRSFFFNLSRVYRYILATEKKDTVSLQDGLKFVKMNFHLIKIRHEEAIFLDIDISESDKDKLLLKAVFQLGL
jgi:LytS/YehU family sensor histidine kinase